MLNLSQTRLDIVRAVRDYHALNGVAPRVTEIAAKVHRSVSLVSADVKRLTEAGVLRHPDYSRQVEMSPGAHTCLDGPRCEHCGQLLPIKQ